MSNKKWLRSGLIYLLIIVAVASIFFIVVPGLGGSDEVSFTEVVRMAKEGEVSSIEVKGEALKVITASGGELKSRIGEGTDITEHIPDTVPVYFKGSGGFNLGLLLNFLPLIFFGALIILLMRQAQGSSNQTMNFGRSKAKMILTSRPTVSFGDVAGADEAKAELQEVVEFLQNPDRFLALGARIPRGVLLVGPTGHWQDPAGQGRRRRSRGAFLSHQRQRVRRDVRWCRRGAGAGPLRPGKAQRALHRVRG